MTGTRETPAQLDSAIDTLLRGPSGPAATAEGELTATARTLRDALPRLHPRFGFEEHLAARLTAARRMAAGLTVPPEPTPLHSHLVVAEVVTEEEEAGAEDVEVEAAEYRRLGLVAGGAIASGVSLAGAALVVWRRSRSRGIF